MEEEEGEGRTSRDGILRVVRERAPRARRDHPRRGEQPPLQAISYPRETETNRGAGNRGGIEAGGRNGEGRRVRVREGGGGDPEMRMRRGVAWGRRRRWRRRRRREERRWGQRSRVDEKREKNQGSTRKPALFQGLKTRPIPPRGMDLLRSRAHTTWMLFPPQ